MTPAAHPLRSRNFGLLWLGQLVSVVGSGLSSFALGIWVYTTTQSATRFALIFLFTALPAVLVSTFAGALVDRLDRRLTMLLADLVAALVAGSAALLALADRLEVWHVYGVAALISVASSFQLPAQAASVPLLVDPGQLNRANGLVQMSRAAAQVLAPATAGVLVSTLSLGGVLLIDAATYLIGVAALAIIRIPRLAAAEAAATASGGNLAAWHFVRHRRGLLALLAEIGLFNFLLGIIGVLITPMLLSFTSPAGLGLQMSVGGAGLLAGGLAMSVWGGPRRRIHGVLGFLALAGVFLVFHGFRPSLLLLCVAGFAFFFTLPVVNASNDAIWQTKVPYDLQGRAFAVQRVVTEAALPLGYVLAGPLADRVFEPLLAAGGPLASSLGGWIGVGPGRGIALMFILAGLAILVANLGGYLYQPMRHLEEELPDVSRPDAPPPAASGPTAGVRPEQDLSLRVPA